MALEYELRFGITADAARAFEKLPLLGAGETENLTNRYFDTADFQLAAAHCSLRLRDDGKHRVQTLKVPSDRPDARHEFEREVIAVRPELSGEEKASLPVGLRDSWARLQLEPVFTTTYRRLAWEVKQGESLIEVALDRGMITAGTAQAPISEVELELKSGRETDVLALAAELGKHVSLLPLAETKSSRGARLARDGKVG